MFCVHINRDIASSGDLNGTVNVGESDRKQVFSPQGAISLQPVRLDGQKSRGLHLDGCWPAHSHSPGMMNDVLEAS